MCLEFHQLSERGGGGGVDSCAHASQNAVTNLLFSHEDYLDKILINSFRSSPLFKQATDVVD